MWPQRRPSSSPGTALGVVDDAGVRLMPVGTDDVGGLAEQSTTDVMCKLRRTINC